MSTSTAGHRRFPALVIVCVLLPACLYLGPLIQPWIAHQLPGITGLARINPSPIILDIPVHLPLTVDLILVPALFILMYVAVILLYPHRGISRWRQLPYRLGAILASVIIVACCVAFGSLLSFVLQDHLPRNVNNGLESLGINADIYLTNKTIPLHGNAIVLLCWIIGIAISFGKINRSPVVKRSAPLTREQRMTPYQRMLEEKRQRAKYGPAPAKATSAGLKSAALKSPAAKGGQAKPERSKVIEAESVWSKPERGESPRSRAEQVVSTPAPASHLAVAVSPAPRSRPVAARPSRVLCCPEPLPALEPEAVNYRPLW